jgi:uncharacterized protein
LPSTPVALMIAGSGPTDRNGNSAFGLNTDSYRQLAASLADSGIASLRFDKRGIGANVALSMSEIEVTLSTFVDDVVMLATWLAQQPEFDRVFLVGHSEGGIIALLAAAQVKLAGLVLLTVPGRPLGFVLLEQLGRQMLPDAMAAATAAVRALETNGQVPELTPPLDKFFRPSVQPFLRSIITIDPKAVLAALMVVTLIIGGGADAQVTRTDFDALCSARAGITAHWEPRMGHTLKIVPEGDLRQVAAYTDPSVPLPPAMVATLTNWIASKRWSPE